MISNLFWLLAVIVGPILLGAAIAYALLRQRRLTSDEQKRSDAAAKELYKHDENADTRHLGGRG